MSEVFSYRNGLQLSASPCSSIVRGKIWGIFAKRHVYTYTNNTIFYDIVEDMLLFLGQPCEMKTHLMDHSRNIQALKQYVLEDAPWYGVFDFVEQYLYSQRPPKWVRTGAAIVDASMLYEREYGEYLDLVDEIDNILTENHTGYGIVEGHVVPMGTGADFNEVKEALKVAPNHVQVSIQKAVALLSLRPQPDNNNAIKEIITATESLCCTIAKEWGATQANTLGDALNYITLASDAHPYIRMHSALKKAIGNLYGYASDEHGIRHGGTTFVEADANEARFMLATCSAIINLLIEKYRALQSATVFSSGEDCQ